MNWKKISWFCAFWLIGLSLSAQNRTITGTVIGAEDNEPLIGVTIQQDGTQNGTTTDIEGKYSIQVTGDAPKLVFRFVGFDTKTVDVGASNVLNVTMASGLELNEVVVTALGISREKKALGYAVQEVDGDDLDKARETNVINALQGKVAGVQITGSSNIGGSSRMIIRGSSSILGNNQPLFVIDGVPIDNSNFTSSDQARGAGGYDYGNAAQDINPDDIESMTVLKGASAAALYGSRAANGVVVITTKKGKKGKGKSGIGVSVNSSLQWSKVYVLPDYQNSYGGGAGPTFDTINGELIPDYGYDGSWGPKLDGRQVRHWDSWYEGESDFGKTRPWEANPDNVKDFFETGLAMTNNVALTGGNDKAAFRLSYTNLDQRGTQPNSFLDRNTVNFNGSSQLSDRFSSSVGLNYVSTKAKGRPQTGYGESVMSQFNQWFQRQLDIDRLKEYETADGTQRTWNRNSSTDPSPHYWDNPYWERYKNVQSDQRDRMFGNITLNYKINDWLNVTGRAMTDFYTDRREERVALGGVRESMYSEDVRTVYENNYELRLTANRNINEDISFTGFVGAVRNDRGYNRNSSETLGGLVVRDLFTLTNALEGIEIRDYNESRRINSLLGSANFGYKNFLYLDLTLRNDWSSTLPEGNNSYLYPSATASFIFSEFLDFDPLSFGKLRMGFAQVGNDTDPYRLANTYQSNTTTGLPGFSVLNSVNNPDLRPEKTKDFELGTELRFLYDRVKLDVAYYNRKTTDQIFKVSQSGASGASSSILNAGTVQNSGIEAMITAIPVKTDDFEWNVGLNFGKNKSEVLELYKDPQGNVVDNIQLTSLFGVALEARVGQPNGVLVGYDYVYDDNGNKLVDPNTGAYLKTDEVKPLGSILADFTGGFRTGFAYKNFELSTLFDFQKGGKIHSLTNQWGKYSGTLEETAEGGIRENGTVVDGVLAEVDGQGNLVRDSNGDYVSSGKANDVSIGAQDHFFLNGGYVVHAADIYDASFIKWRELRVTYNFPKEMTRKLKIENLRVSLVGRNLAILHKNVPHVDPEAAVSSGNVQGFEGGQLPTERTIGVNLNFNF